MPDTQTEELLRRYVQNSATEEETRELLLRLRSGAGDAALEQYIMTLTDQPDAELTPETWKQLWSGIMPAVAGNKSTQGGTNVAPLKRIRWRAMAAAAAVTSLLVAGAWLYHRGGQAHKPAAIMATIIPGDNKATLTLANGQQIILDNAASGALAQENGVQVIKLNDGLLQYNASGSNSEGTATVSWNTIQTPAGGQYQVILPDGSHVWMNSSSSLRFPTAFAGKTRDVQLAGEAYFEIATAVLQPFTVQVNGHSKVLVLGTSFNINAYTDEAYIKTTLLTGAVNVSNTSYIQRLLPGEQGVWSGSNSIINIAHPDTTAVMAWKNGLFQFNKADIRSVMRQLSRWYNVSVEFEGEIPADDFSGKISRKASIEDVLKILKLSDVNAHIENRKIIIGE